MTQAASRLKSAMLRALPWGVLQTIKKQHYLRVLRTLRVEDEPAGAIAIYQLLQQKDGFSPLDRELFTLLAGQAATAILASKLYSQSERKLSTIQGFIDLLTK